MENKVLFEALYAAMNNFFAQVVNGNSARVSEANEVYINLSELVTKKKLWPEFNDWLDSMD